MVRLPYYFRIWVSRGQLGLGCDFLCSSYCLCGFGVSRCDSQTGLSEGWPCFLLSQTSQGQTAGSKQWSQDEELSSLIHRTNGHLARGSWPELSEESSLWSCCGTSPPGRGEEARPRLAWATPLSSWSNNTREDSTHGHHQMVNTEISLIIFFAAKDGEALHSQQKQDRELTVT